MAIDVTAYWTGPPPKRSANCAKWLRKIKRGWRPNRRIRQMNYHAAAVFFGVYIWELTHVLWPAMTIGQEEDT
jgi:hypothetical protein